MIPITSTGSTQTDKQVADDSWLWAPVKTAGKSTGEKE